MRDEPKPAGHLIVACDDRDRGGCGRAITEITGTADGDVKILGPLVAQNGDPGGTLTTMVPDMRITRRRRGTAVGDTTDPADRPPPPLRADLLEARRLADEAGEPFPDGVPYADAVAAEIAKHERQTREWDATGTSSGTGRRTFVCWCRRRRRATGHAGPAERSLPPGHRRWPARITLDDLRRAAG
jgi:hypothetical protein